MNKKLYTAPTVATIDILPCQLMAESLRGKGSVTEDSNNPGEPDIILPTDGSAETGQEEFISLDDPHLWY